MTLISAALATALALFAQDGGNTQTQAAVELSDAEAGVLGGFVADQVDANPAAEEMEKSLQSKIEEIKKARTSTTGSDAPAKGKKKKKKSKAAPAPSADSIKNGLTESDRRSLGKTALAEINAGHHGSALVETLKKELERLRAERVKESSTASTPKKKKKKSES